MDRQAKGLFISIEGGEGVGKSVFCAQLKQKLLDSGVKVLVTREPGGSKNAEKIRALFKNVDEQEALTPQAELFLVAAARHQHVCHHILPHLRQGYVVLCDRFSDSSRVYQGELGGIASPFLEAVLDVAAQGLRPHLTFLLDCEVEIGLKRLAAREIAGSQSQAEKQCRYDKADKAFHEKLRQAYLRLAQKYPDRIYTLDAGLSTPHILEEAWRILTERFPIAQPSKT